MPESIEVHRLSVPDERAILEWTKGKTDGYAEHLRNLCAWVNDDRVLEYGIFRNGNMIGAVGCGIDSAHEFSLNNCINILLDERDDELYREVFKFVSNDVIQHDIIPFDNIQYGEYADEHGGFSSEKMGYELANRPSEKKSVKSQSTVI